MIKSKTKIALNFRFTLFFILLQICAEAQFVYHFDFGKFNYRYDDLYASFHLNPPKIISSKSIRSETIFEYRIKKNIIIDSTMLEIIHYDDLGRVIQMLLLHKDGLSADKIIDLSYPDSYTWKIKETGKWIDGIDFYFNGNGTLDRTYKYRILPSHPHDTVFTTLIKRTYDSVNNFVTDSVKIDNKAMFFSDKWHYDDPNFNDYESYDATGKMTYRYSTIVDSDKRISSIFRETDYGKKVILQQVSYNDSNQPERENDYSYDLSGLQTKIELVYLYYPDKIIYQASFKSGVFNNLLRHYYYGK